MEFYFVVRSCFMTMAVNESENWYMIFSNLGVMRRVNFDGFHAVMGSRTNSSVINIHTKFYRTFKTTKAIQQQSGAAFLPTSKKLVRKSLL